MNGTYQPLINYISEDSYRKINEYESKRQDELEFRVKNFFDKYADVDNIEDFNKIISLEDVRKTR